MKRKRNFQVLKNRNMIFIVDASKNLFAFDGSGWSRFHALMWNGSEWVTGVGPAMVYNDHTKQYSVIDKKRWQEVTWLEALLVSGDSKRKILQQFRRLLNV